MHLVDAFRTWTRGQRWLPGLVLLVAEDQDLSQSVPDLARSLKDV